MKHLRYPLFVAFLLVLLSACDALATPSPTPTPVPATKTPIPTATATVKPIPPTPTQQIDFLINGTTFPSCYGKVGESGEGWEHSVEKDRLHISVTGVEIFLTCQDYEFSNFILEADATLVDDGKAHLHTTFGFVFRVNPNFMAQYYQFVITPNGYETMWYGNNNEVRQLYDWKPSPQFKAGETMHLKMMAVGDQFSFYLNDTLINKVQDANLKSGWIGFSMGETSPEAGEVIFENAKISVIP